MIVVRKTILESVGSNKLINSTESWEVLQRHGMLSSSRAGFCPHCYLFDEKRVPLKWPLSTSWWRVRLNLRQKIHLTKKSHELPWSLHVLLFFCCTVATVQAKTRNIPPFEQHATVNYRCSVARPRGVITWKNSTALLFPPVRQHKEQSVSRLTESVVLQYAYSIPLDGLKNGQKKSLRSTSSFWTCRGWGWWGRLQVCWCQMLEVLSDASFTDE